MRFDTANLASTMKLARQHACLSILRLMAAATAADEKASTTREDLATVSNAWHKRRLPGRSLNILSRFAVCTRTSYLLMGLLLATETAPATADVALYLNQVKPVLKERCYACHAALKQEGGLRVDTGQSVIRGGDSGSIVVVGSADESMLMQRITARDEGERMPPEGAPLSDEQIESIRQWIFAGAEVPDDEMAEPDPDQHWAFQRPDRRSLSSVGSLKAHASSSRNPIDLLIEVNRSPRGLVSTGPAPRALLLRRVYLDLVGLPPTLEEIDSFCRDSRPDAYERRVDVLLDSPQYGERWGRHWMDVWRYTDWYGLGAQLRYSQKHIWHWRDWIVESLNADKGYDQMVLEMLAADERAPTDRQALRATGFLARNYFLFNRTTWLDHTLEHTAKAFLGLTVNCTKCHDHKYDPISQLDYYALRAIFEPHQVRLDVRPGETDLEQDGIPRVFDAHPETPTYLHVRGDDKQPDTSQVIQPDVPQFLAMIPFAPQSIDLPPQAFRPGIQASFWRDHLQRATEETRAAASRLVALQQHPPADQSGREPAEEHAVPADEVDVWNADVRVARCHAKTTALRVALLSAMQTAELAKLQDATCEVPVRAAALAARQWELADAQWQVARAERELLKPDPPKDAQQKLANAQQRLGKCEQAVSEPGMEYPVPHASVKALEGPDEKPQSQFAAYPMTSTGRRQALAEWIVHPSHPLTARVAVNHMWLRHFGQPLVDPVDDFGRRTAAPVQQPLLDWLAVELIESGWRMKHLHRLIVTSDTYRLAGADVAVDASTRATDPENHYYWCRKPMRMQSEMVRDSLLHLAGALDLQLGGPTLNPVQDVPPHRRSLYFTHSRDDQHPLLAMFDDADIEGCYRRQESIVPQQALALANSRLSLTMSERIAQRVSGGPPDDSALGVDDAEFVQRVFRALLAREPEPGERQACLRALEQWRQIEDAEAVLRARANLTHALLNHNDFVTIR